MESSIDKPRPFLLMITRFKAWGEARNRGEEISVQEKNIERNEAYRQVTPGKSAWGLEKLG